RPCGPDIMVNMSVWEDLESLREFVYRSGPHLDFMRRRRAWFHPMTVPYMVLWWVPAGHIPRLDEAPFPPELPRPPGPRPRALPRRRPLPRLRSPPKPPSGRLRRLGARQGSGRAGEPALWCAGTCCAPGAHGRERDLDPQAASGSWVDGQGGSVGGGDGLHD